MSVRSLLVIALVGCSTSVESWTPLELDGFMLLDDRGILGDGPIEVGEDLGVTVRGLRPDTDHTFVVTDDTGERLFTLAATTDTRGSIERLLLWPDLGLGDAPESPWFATRELAGAQDRLGGRGLRVRIEQAGESIGERAVVVADRLAKPRVYAVDESGRIARAVTADSGPLRIVGAHLERGEVAVTLLAERAAWNIGDVVEPALSRSGEPLVWRTEIDDRGELAVVVDPRELPPGSFQIAVQPVVRPGRVLRVDSSWLFGKQLAPSVVVPVAPYWTGAAIQIADVSSRATSAAPYFAAEDVLFAGEPVWATIQMPPGPAHAAPARKVRFYVVPHRTADEWRTNAPLVDVSGHVVEALVTLGGTSSHTLIGAALAPGRYDIVIDTGNQPLNPGGFQSDDRFDAASDVVDGVTRVGFTILDDYGAPGPDAVGRTQYAASDISYSDAPCATHTVRVTGAVRYPAVAAGVDAAMPAGTFPVVVVAHGNNLPSDGHLQLLEHLASHGYIAVAIELGDLTFACDPIGLKARHLLEHVALLSDPARQPAVLQGHVDVANISLAGHSQGGDAALRAAYLAKRDGLAFRARAVIALAPTDGSGRQPDPSVIDAPYLAVFGSADHDVGRSGGFPFADPSHGGTAFRAYERNTGIKAMVFVDGACHNLFNEQYTGCESLAPELSQDVHQQLARGYVTAFLAWHVGGDELQRALFETGSLRGSATVVHHQLRDPTARVLDDFEDIIAGTNTTGGTNAASGFASAAEDALWLLDRSAPHGSRGRLLRWTSTGAEYRLRLPQATDLSTGEALSLRVAQAVGFLHRDVAVASEGTALDGGQIGPQVAAWIQALGTLLPGASAVVEIPGARWRLINGAQHLIGMASPGSTAGAFWLGLRNADIAETYAAMPLRVRLTDLSGRSRAITVTVEAPVVPKPYLAFAFDAEMRTLAALATLRIPIAAFAIPDASGPGVDPRQIVEVAIETVTPTGAILLDDIEVATP